MVTNLSSADNLLVMASNLSIFDLSIFDDIIEILDLLNYNGKQWTENKKNW